MSTLSETSQANIGWVYPPQPQTQFVTETVGLLSGTEQLIDGQDYIEVVFPVAQVGSTWTMLEAVVVNDVDANALNIWAGVITEKTAEGFIIQLNGIPDSDNYYLSWSIKGISSSGQATTYTLAGPTSGKLSTLSSNFTVALPAGSTVAATVTVTPNDGGGGGTFTPSSVQLTTAVPSATFKYTPASYGVKTIATTNTGGLTNPSSKSFTSVAATYTFSGPSSGDEGVPSTDFTVELPSGGVVLGIVTITPSDDGDGGVFTPTTVDLTTASPSATFTYTPASDGDKTLSVSNSGTMTDPSDLVYTADPVAGVHLLDTLISYWKLDEASGTRNDTHGTNHLADTGSTGAFAAIINNGAYFNSANFLSVASNAGLQATGDLTFSLWVRVDNPAGAASYIFGKFDGANADYALSHDPATGFGYNTGGVVASVGSPAGAFAWYHVVGWYDSADNLTRIRVNDASTQVSTSATLVTTTSAFVLGALNTAPLLPFTGLVDEVGFWKRVLTPQEITALYNSGAGLAYGSFTA